MGITASLFYSANGANKQTLHQRITPSEQQFEEQQERWNALAEHLTSDLHERSGYPMRTWLQGSYKFGTQVRPAHKGDEFDIDLGVYFQWQGLPEDGDYELEKLKNMVQQSLQAYPGDGVIEVVSPPKERCSRIRFDGDFHIDIPSYHLDPDRDARILATEQNGWEDSDPKAFYMWFENQFDDYIRTKARRQVRYVKCWAGLNFRDGDGRPSSTLLTVLVAEALDQLTGDELASDDDALLAVLEEIVDRLERDRKVVNPATEDDGEVLSERLSHEEFDEFVDKLRAFRDTAQDALACDSEVATACRWSDAFEHFILMPDEKDLEKSSDYRTQLPVPLVRPEVSVRAVAKQNPLRHWEDMNEIGPIPKDCDIYFEVTNPGGLPIGAEIEWMVRNEGHEAEFVNDLGHRAGEGLIGKERSAYNGTHYMDCVVKRYGQVVGLRRIPVTIRGPAIPPRNPPRRPAYVRLRGRR